MAIRAVNNQQSYVLGDINFIGMDTRTQPNKLKDGYAQNIENMMVDGNSLVVRNGFKGICNTFNANPVYELTTLKGTSGVSKLVYAKNGKLFTTDPSATPAVETEITDQTTGASFVFPSLGKDVRMTQYGRYIYGVGGSGSAFSLFRTNGTIGASMPSVAGPTSTKPNAVGITKNLKQYTSGTYADSAANATFASSTPSDNRVLNPLFATAGASTCANWNVTAGQPSIGTGSGNDIVLKAIPWAGKKGTVSKGADGRTSGFMAHIDQPQDYIIQDITGLPTYTQNGSTAKVNGLFRLSFYLMNYDDAKPFNGQYVNVIVKGHSGSVPGTGNLINGAVFQAVADAAPKQTTADWILFEYVVDFREFESTLVSLQLSISNGGWERLDGPGILIDGVYMYSLLSSANDTGITTDLGLATISAVQVNSNITGMYGGYVQNRLIKLSLGGSLDMSSDRALGIRAELHPNIRTNGLPISLGIQESSGAINWTGQAIYNAQSRFLEFQLFPIPATVRDAVTALYLRFDEDIEDVSNSSLLIGLGDVVRQGGLLPDNQYKYIFTRWKAAPAAWRATSAYAISAPPGEGIETTSSDFSQQIESSVAYSRGRITFTETGLRNSTTDYNYDYLLIYRRCDTIFTDGMPRLIGMIPINLGTASSYTGQAAQVFDYAAASPALVAADGLTFDVSWATNVGTYTIYDDVKDTNILYSTNIGRQGDFYHSGNDQLPTGLSSIASHKQRLFVSKDNALYASWPLNKDNEYGVYTTNIPNVQDPFLAVKGALMTIGSQDDKEKIVNLLSYAGDGVVAAGGDTSAVLIAFRENSIVPIMGFDPTSFQAQQFVREPGAGLLAPKGIASVIGKPLYVTSSGISTMAGTTIEPVSLPLEGVLNPRSSDFGPTGSASYISAAAYSGIILLTHERRLYAFAPVAGATTSTSNSVCYVWDSRTTGWVKWNLPIFSATQTFATSAVSCTSTNDVADMYVGGSNGQVFRLEGFADRPTYSGANSNIAWKLLTRQYGQTYAEGVAYYGVNRPHQCNIHYYSPLSTTITWKVTSNRNSTGYSKNYTTAVNEDKAIALRQLPVDLRGSWLQLELTGSVQSRLEIHAASIQSTESAVRRS
jgi:hypothetical protein